MPAGILPATAPSRRQSAWLEEQDEAWQTDRIAECRDRFLDALAKIEEGMKPKPKPMAQPAPPPPPQPMSFIIFFDFDSSDITVLAGRIRFGPDSEYVERVSYEVDPTKAAHFAARVQRYLPGLRSDWLSPDYAGVRPKLAGPGEPPDDRRTHERLLRRIPSRGQPVRQQHHRARHTHG